MAKRKFGYEIIIETDSAFKEQVIGSVIEDFIKSLGLYRKDGRLKKYKVLWRPLQPDEIP